MIDSAQIYCYLGVEKDHCCFFQMFLEYTHTNISISFHLQLILSLKPLSCNCSYSLKCDLLWSTSWIMLHVSRSLLCNPLHEQGLWSAVPKVAKKAFLHSASVPRIKAGSIRVKHSIFSSSLSLHFTSSELQHLSWNVSNRSLVNRRKCICVTIAVCHTHQLIGFLQFTGTGSVRSMWLEFT